MMIAAVVRVGQLALAEHRAAELAAPDDQRVVEQAALLQIGDERRRRLIRALALQREIARQIVVLIPAAMIELDEAHVALGEPPRQQAVGGVRARLARLRAVHLEDRVGLLRQIHQVRHGRLHPVRHLVLRDARFDLRIAVRVVLHAY